MFLPRPNRSSLRSGRRSRWRVITGSRRRSVPALSSAAEPERRRAQKQSVFALRLLLIPLLIGYALRQKASLSVAEIGLSVQKGGRSARRADGRGGLRRRNSAEERGRRGVFCRLLTERRRKIADHVGVRRRIETIERGRTEEGIGCGTHHKLAGACLTTPARFAACGKPHLLRPLWTAGGGRRRKPMHHRTVRRTGRAVPTEPGGARGQRRKDQDRRQQQRYPSVSISDRRVHRMGSIPQNAMRSFPAG